MTLWFGESEPETNAATNFSKLLRGRHLPGLLVNPAAAPFARPSAMILQQERLRTGKTTTQIER
jgi:hypothetical protein